jgi:hypothetical protein
MKKLHLDSEYRDRWEEFYLFDGTVEDSRLKNWREVAWDKVVCIEAHLLEHVHVVNCSGLCFRTFMNFRWGGQEAIFDDNGKYLEHKAIKIWTIGWTDGENCFLKDIDFYTGKQIKDYVAPLSQFTGHLHPAVKDKVLACGR